MSDQRDQSDRMGQTDHPQHRAGDGEGVRAPFAQDTGGPPQQSVFDGAGNETVVTTVSDEQGTRQGTGASAAEATEDAASGERNMVGEGFGPSAG